MKIVETINGSVTSTKQFISGEERDGSGAVTKQFFSRGQRNGSTNYFYFRDHLGSIRSVSDDSGVVQASFSFDPYGRSTQLEGAADSDFGFAGMYIHARSGMNLTQFRAYSPSLGIWLSRDPVGEGGYNYADGDAVNMVDPLGLRPLTAGEKAFVRKWFGNCLDPDKINIFPIAGGRSLSPGYGIIFMTSYQEAGLDLSGSSAESITTIGDFAHELFHAYQHSMLGDAGFYSNVIPGQVLNTLHDARLSPYNPYTPPTSQGDTWRFLSLEAQAQYFGEAVASGKDPLGILKNFRKKCGCK